MRDGSIGPAGAVESGVDLLGGEATYLIEGRHGRLSGQSLFHSFSEFSVGANETATFSEAGLPAGATVEHVVSRLLLVRNRIVFDGAPAQLPALWHDPSHVH